jgi:Flp pilus assembly protein TadD/organic radical activating enzyme
MFNWFKKTSVAENVAPESDVATAQGGDSIAPLATSESEALKNQGNAHLGNGQLDDAAECFRQAIALNPLYAEAYTNLGFVFRLQSNLGEAVALFRKAALINPNLLPAHLNLGVALMSLGQDDAAEESLRRVIALAPEHPVALQSLGVIAAQRDDFPQAETFLRRALELQPDYAEAHNNLGNLLQLTKRLPEAEASYLHALVLQPDYAEAHNNLGNLLQLTKRLPEAEASYRRALELKPDYAEAHNNLGLTLKELSRLDEAEGSYRKALQIRPDYAEAHCNLGVTLHELGRLNETEVSFRRALQIKSDYAEAHCNLGIILKETCRLDEAEASYRRALEIKPDFAIVHSHLGDTLRNLGRLTEAEVSYRRALETKPDNASISQLIFSNYGRWLYGRGLHRESVHYFQQAFAQRVGWHHDSDKDLSSGLVHAYIELTNKCNFHCDFCPSDSQQRNKHFMSMGLVQQLYDEFAENSLAQQVHLHLMGEPSLHPGLVDVLAYASSKNIKTSIVTNGSTLNSKTIPIILDALYGILAVSLQTPTRETFKHRGNTGLSWDRYIENIRLLVREYLKRIASKRTCRSTLELRVMVTKDSKLPANIIESPDDIRGVMNEWRDFVAEIEIEFGLTPFRRKESFPETLATLTAQAEMKYPLQQGVTLSFWQGFTFANSMLSSAYSLENKKSTSFCSRPFIDVAVLSNGDVTLCCLDYDGKLAVGNVKDSTIKAVLNEKPTMDLRAAMLGHHPLPPFCQQCQAETVIKSPK